MRESDLAPKTQANPISWRALLKRGQNYIDVKKKTWIKTAKNQDPLRHHKTRFCVSIARRPPIFSHQNESNQTAASDTLNGAQKTIAMGSVSEIMGWTTDLIAGFKKVPRNRACPFKWWSTTCSAQRIGRLDLFLLSKSRGSGTVQGASSTL